METDYALALIGWGGCFLVSAHARITCAFLIHTCLLIQAVSFPAISCEVTISLARIFVGNFIRKKESDV